MLCIKAGRKRNRRISCGRGRRGKKRKVDVGVPADLAYLGMIYTGMLVGMKLYGIIRHEEMESELIHYYSQCLFRV